jgi:uncharacterized phage infection (PIP) family protein YhgE
MAKAEVATVATTAAEGAKQVAGEATAQTKAVISQAKQQVDGLVTQTREEVRQQAEERSAQAADGLRRLSEQVAALAEGQPDNAGSLPRYLEEVQEHVLGLASRLEHGGPQGIVDDVSRFARRRPGLFLAGAVGAGFVVGRVVRASSGHEHSAATRSAEMGSRQLAASMSTASVGAPRAAAGSNDTGLARATSPAGTDGGALA